MKPYSQPIFTLNARGNVMLEVTRDYFQLSNQVMHREIQGMHIATQEILSQNNIQYSKLKSALIPRADRMEACFIFDSECIESSWYGFDVAEAMLPLYDKRSTQCVLCGDFIGEDQRLIFDILQESLVLSRGFEFIHGTSLYCVYVNNLTEVAVDNFHQSLSKYNPYIGYIPTMYNSRAKTYLSTILVNSFLKYKNTVIMGHEDDRPNTENVNMIGYPFESHGYNVVSLQSSYYDLFLGYKIERAVITGFEVDTEMSITAITSDALHLINCTVCIDDAKHKYLKTEKSGKLQKAGISEIDKIDLAKLIKEKIEASYIYNLMYLDEHDVIKFNIMLEVPRDDGGHPTRLVAALELNLRMVRE